MSTHYGLAVYSSEIFYDVHTFQGFRDWHLRSVCEWLPFKTKFRFHIFYSHFDGRVILQTRFCFVSVGSDWLHSCLSVEAPRSDQR